MFSAQVLHAQVVAFEGDQFPEEMGYERVGTFDADRSLVNGVFIIDVDFGTWGPPPFGEQDFYKLDIPEFAGSPFFVQWRCRSSAPNSEIPGVGGSVLNALGASTGTTNHFNITEDKVRIWRGNQFPFVWVNITREDFHVYRVENYGGQLYIHFLDGEIVDSGIPEGDFPGNSSRIIWGSSVWFDESTNEWDYVRFGVIPADGGGDFDSDGAVDGEDYYFFHECAANSAPGVDAGPGCRWADMDADSDVDLTDFQLFQLAFTGQ